MNKSIKIKHDDQVVFEGISRLSFESEETNIEVDYSDSKGFRVSVYDIKKKIMHYYDVVDGQLKLSSKENTESGEEMLIRDDIKDKIFDLITANFTDPKFRVHEHFTWEQMSMEITCVQHLSDMAAITFEIEIPFSEVMKWTTVKDIVNYIETALENQDA